MTTQARDFYVQQALDEPEDHFSQVPNELIRDRSISSACRMLIIFITSQKRPWKFHFKELSEVFDEKIGKEKLYKLIREARDAGYILMERFLENQLTRYRYFISKFPRFKKCFRYTAFRDPENPGTLKNTDISSSSVPSEESISKKEKTTPPPPEASSPTESAAEDLLAFCKTKILEKHPSIKPKEKAWRDAIDRMLRIDKRPLDEVKEVLVFALEDSFWSKQVQSPTGLRTESQRDGVQKYDKILAAYRPTRQRRNNVKFLAWMHSKLFKENGHGLKHLKLNEPQTWIEDTSRGVEISTEQDEMLFKVHFKTFIGRPCTAEELAWKP